MNRMKSSSPRHFYWLVGGLVGMVLGILAGLYILSNIDLPNQELYIAIYRACATIVVISIVFGVSVGVAIGKIVSLLGEIYKKGSSH